MKNTIKTTLTTVALCFIIQLAYSQRYTSEIFSHINIEVDSNIVYGQNYELISPFQTSVSLEDLVMDVYQPKQSVDTVSERPLMIYLHTGDFLNPPTNGTPTGLKNDLTAVEICRQFAKRGYVAASINYRVNWNPVSTNPDIRKGTYLRALYRAVIDAKTAVRFFKNDYANNNNQYNINPNQIMLFGEETGGYISLAYATLDKFSELTLPKLLDANAQPIIDVNVIGDIDGYGGTENHDNYPGISSEVQLVANIGGALIDTSWLELGDPPMVSFQCPRDPRAPYLDGTIVVPTTNEDVVDVQGTGVYMQNAVATGNNNAFVNANLNDPITQNAQSAYNQTIAHWDANRGFSINTAGDEGLYPFVLPLAPSGQRFENQNSPWQFWDPNSSLAQQMPLGSQMTAHESALLSNPDMSRNKAMNYIDTIQWYLQPRAVLALGLDTTTTFHDPDLGLIDSTTIISNGNSPPNNNFSVSGQITKGLSNVAQNAMVYLISEDSISGSNIQLTLIDSQYTDLQGYYSFNPVDSGEYYLKASLNSSDPDYSSFIPTYFDVSLFWDNATSILVDDSISNVNIALIGGNNQGGPGFISGNIYQGAGKNGSASAAGNILIYLLDNNDSPVQYTYSNSSGYFQFSNLAYGEYKVYAEVLNKETEAPVININSKNERVDSLHLEIQAEKVVEIKNTGISNNSLLNRLHIYPNPVLNSLILNFDLKQETEIEIRLSDILGREVFRQNLGSMPKGQHNITLDIPDLNSGLYLLTTFADGMNAKTLKLVKK